MRHLHFFLGLLSALASTLNAQDYRCVYPGDTAYYADEHNRIVTIRVAEIEEYDDSTVYIFPEHIQNKSSTREMSLCYSPFEASWMGPKYSFTSKGMHYFFPRLYPHESTAFTLRSNARAGESWICYREAEGDSVTATLTAKKSLDFLGVTDSVIIINFIGHFNNNKSLNAKMEELEIILSKNHGLVNTLNFYYFPEIEGILPDEYLQQYLLKAGTGINNDFRNITWEEVYDFNPGDIFHVSTDVSRNYYEVPTVYRSFQDEIRRVISKEGSADSVVYGYERKWRLEETWSHKPGTYSAGMDTITEVYKKDSSFNTLPGEPVFSNDFLYSYFMINSYPLAKIKPSFHEFLVHTGDSCWSPVFADGCFPTAMFIEGLGGPYGTCTGFFEGSSYQKKLVYFEKDGVGLGTPLEINVGTDENILKPGFSLFPNPVQNQLKINDHRNTQGCIIRIIDLEANLILSEKLKSNTTNISLDHIPSGMYLYQIVQEGKILQKGKFIKE